MILNQVFNPAVKCMILTDDNSYNTDIGKTNEKLGDVAPSIALQIEIRVECRGAKMGYGKLQ